jgi:hypothetical protein
MLEREAHPEVGGQAERADHLGGTNSLILRCFDRHCPTVTESAKAHYLVVPDGEARVSRRL